jgi:hypothetical protein
MDKETGERLVIGIDYGTTYTGTQARRGEFYGTVIDDSVMTLRRGIRVSYWKKATNN